MISPYIRDTILGEMMTNNKINIITISETSHTQPDKSRDWDYEGYVMLPELTCQKCGESFTHNAEFERHVFSHVGYRPYACSICEKAYSKKRYLLEHVRASHPDVYILEQQTDGSRHHTHTRTFFLQKGKEFNTSVSDVETGLCMHS